jgi:hypothetical protein
MTRSILANFENGSRPYLTLTESAAIAVALGVYLVDLITDEDDTSNVQLWTAPWPVDRDGRRKMTTRELRLRLGGTPMPSELATQIEANREAAQKLWNLMFRGKEC